MPEIALSQALCETVV